MDSASRRANTSNMGLISRTKQNIVATDARKAIEDGRQVFAAMFNTPAMRLGLSGSIDDWSMMIDVIEAEGWHLDHWAVSLDRRGRPQAYPLFRRARP